MSRDDEFVRETRASVRELTNGLVELERDGGSREHVDELFRTAHTLKGNCSMAGLDGASRVAHALEDFLSDLRDGSLSPTPDLIDAALAAVDDIDARLDESDDEPADPETTVATLRAEMDRYRGESEAASEWGESAERDPDSTPDEPTEQFDQTVVDALESASGFDDLEGLLDEMDDPEETTEEEPSRWGTFDSSESVPSPPDDSEPEPEPEPEPSDADASAGDEDHPGDASASGVESQSSGPMDEFASIKDGVQRDDVSSLDRELVDVEFGEFDHDDELSIQELIDGEVAGPSLSDDEDAEREAQEASSADGASPARGDDTIRPEDFGYEPAVPSTPDEASAPNGAERTDEEAVTASADDEENPFETTDVVDPDEVSADVDPDSASGDVGDGEAAGGPELDADATEPGEAVDSDDEAVEPDTGETEPDTGETGLGEGTEPASDRPSVGFEPAAESSSSGSESPSPDHDTSDTDVDISIPDGETVGPAGDDAGVSEAAAEGSSAPGEDESHVDETANEPEFPASFAEDDGGPADEGGDEPFPDVLPDDVDLGDEFSDDQPGDDIDLGDEFSDEFADALADVETPGDDLSEDLSEPFTDDAASPEFDDGLDLPDDFLSGSLGGERGAADDAPTASGDVDVATGGRVDDLDLPDIDLPDVDELTAGGFAGAETAGGSDDDVSFERDEHTMAFESRFAERFGGGSDNDRVQLVQVASSTIEESSLDAARYQSSGTADYPLEFGETQETERIQSLTVDVENADTLLNLVEELSLTQLRIKQSDGEDLDDHLSVMDSVTGELRRAVMNLRLMPLSTAIDGLPRVVRDVARKQDKEVAFEVSDEGVDLDRSIVEKLGDPLVHLVRNAVDHGIEPPGERVQQGKPREGTVELRAWRDRERVVIEVEDDGRGISAERIRQQAIDHDVISREAAERMSFDEVYDLVFEPGFSTADEVTDVSGRGVGMDAVRRTVNSLDGTVDIESEPGSGTTVRVRLPVSVAVSKMLFVGVGPEQYAIPASAVADVELVDEADLDDDGTVAVEWPEEVSDRPDRVPYRRLTEALNVDTGGDAAAQRPDDRRVLVRLDPESSGFALVCDEVDDAREVVVKPYEKLLGDVPGVSGATMSGDGTLVNIIDVTTL